MIDKLLNANIAIIGGGNFCRSFLEYILGDNFKTNSPNVLGIADLNPAAESVQFAKEHGIFTTRDYTELYALEGLDLLLELTIDPVLAEEIKNNKPAHIGLIDHFEARSLWDLLKIEDAKRSIMREFETKQINGAGIDPLVEQLLDAVENTIKHRNRRSRDIERDCFEAERTLSQIIQGSTMPTFVINRHHYITHWNKAMERLSGFKATDMIGTKDQWRPFYSSKRPSMADVIIDRFEESQISELYGSQWRPSALIEGAFEAEAFFPKMGAEGKWCWFTAAPIKAPDGTIIAAIETLQDRTEDKNIEQERNQHTRLLSKTAKELAESQEVMTQIIQGSTIPTFVLDQDHVITHWNKAAERLTGLLAADMIGTRNQWTPFYDSRRPVMADVIIDQIDETQIQKLYGASWRKSALIGGAYEAEGFFPRLGDDGRWCWFTAAPIKTADGTLIGAIETLWDKTEDKRAEEEREHHTRELTTLVSIYTALSASSDIEKRIKRALREMKDFLSADGICFYLREQQGQYHLRYGHGLSEEICDGFKIADGSSIIHQVADSNRFTIFEDLPDGFSDEVGFLDRHRLSSLVYIPISSKEGESLGVIRIGSRLPHQFTHDQQSVLELIGNRIGVAIENAMLQEQYKKSEEKYRTLFNSDPHPIFILSINNFVILDMNQRAEDTYGFTRDELLGVPFLNLGDETDVELSDGLGSLCKDRSVTIYKKRHYRKDGKPFFINCNLSRASYGEHDVVIASTTDISESVEKEAQLVQASKMTTLGTMAAGMAHEINQPLNVIQVCSDFMRKMLDRGVALSDEELRTMCDDIGDNVQRAAGIIKHMRDFSRQSEMVKTKLFINDPIKDVFKVLGHQLKVHQIELDLDLDPDIPPIMAEHNRLEQVFINLVTNAVDAMDEKGEKLAGTKWERRLAIKSFSENGQVVVTVCDSGVGMPADIIDKIFEPFFTTKEVGKGTGLGVAISYGIVKDYEGDITVSSTPGEGTCFELRFPVYNPRGDDEDA